MFQTLGHCMGIAMSDQYHRRKKQHKRVGSKNQATGQSSVTAPKNRLIPKELRIPTSSGNGSKPKPMRKRTRSTDRSAGRNCPFSSMPAITQHRASIARCASSPLMGFISARSGPMDRRCGRPPGYLSEVTYVSIVSKRQCLLTRRLEFTR